MSDRRAVRTFDAPTRAEAEQMAAPVLAAFAAAGWVEQERLWIPGDRRVGLGESLLIDHEAQNLLEAEGTLRIAWTTASASAAEPATAAAPRRTDLWESMGGVRYRRLVPQWIIGAIVLVVGAILMLSWFSAQREAMGFGSVCGIALPGRAAWWHQWTIMVMPPGAFFMLALVVWLCAVMTRRQGGKTA